MSRFEEIVNEAIDSVIPVDTLHAEELDLPHPVTGELVHIVAPRPHELNVALKYLRRYATPGGAVKADDVDGLPGAD